MRSAAATSIVGNGHDQKPAGESGDAEDVRLMRLVSRGDMRAFEESSNDIKVWSPERWRECWAAIQTSKTSRSKSLSASGKARADMFRAQNSPLGC